MASARLTAHPVRSLVAALGSAVLLVVIPVTAGHADPGPSVAQATAQVSALETKMEQATEEYDKATTQLHQSEQRAATLRKQAAAQQKVVDRYREQIAEFAASAYRGGNISQLTSLLDSGSSQNFLDQVTTLDQVAKSQRDQLNLLVAAEETLAHQNAQIETEVTNQKKTEQKLAQQKTTIQQNLTKWRSLASQAQRAVQARADVQAASRGSFRQPMPTYTGPASGAAAAAVHFAYAQLGKPYSWGAAGPGSYDCSGLTMASWAAAGVSLPHSAGMQYGSIQHVSLSALQPGDLVFFGSPIHHVGIYIGGGNMIHAPVPGDVVKISRISIMPIAGAGRP